MALATILNAVTANTAGTAASVSGPCSVGWRGDIADMDGRLRVEVSLDGTNYVTIDMIDKERPQVPIAVNVQGSYKVNVSLEEQTATPSPGITVVSLQ